ncbi:DSC E3 ubiquitin ligase complex subunit 1 [Pleurostoma richardsiae]|uniref:DSC E3 ubiquitin ligase complex subunit A n=1 Tax=Pleurostoma richardsiae TaxID=41990 RepID=A0AA38RTW3_9PEZI|nr:DSC E3 ubiquitin ligase complex subunit 1 [Pleurostoma richardsiae]
MPPPQENARAFLFIIMMLWILSTPDNSPGLLSSPLVTSSRLERQRHAHGVLNSTKWGDFSPRQAGDPEGAPRRYLNLTGFRKEDGLAWDDLQNFRDRCLDASRATNKDWEGNDLWSVGKAQPTWQNATGVVKGPWVRQEASVPRYPSSYNLVNMTPEVTWSGAASEWARNLTSLEGSMLLRLEDRRRTIDYGDIEEEGYVRAGDVVREVAATASIEDDAKHGGSGSTYDMRLHGVHWPRQGTMLLTTTSEKFAGIFGLPHLSPGPNFFASSQKLLNMTIDEVLRKREMSRFSDPSNPWGSNPNGPEDNWDPSPHCEYIFYLQVHPLAPFRLQTSPEILDVVQGIENELRNPQGAPVPPIPELQMSAVVYSPDCAYFVESKGPPHFSPEEGRHLVGVKEEVFLYRAKVWLIAFAALLFAQIQLLKSQMRESYTPSTMGRISFWTASIMVMADGLVFAGSSAWSLSASVTFLPSLMVTFAAFLSMTVGGSFLAEIYNIQEPERRNRDREHTPNNSTPRPPATPAPTGDTLPRPVTAPPLRNVPTPPIIIPSDQDIDAEIAENTANGATAVPTAAGAATENNTQQRIRATTFSTIAGRFILIGTCILFLSLASMSWWASLRAAYVNTVAFIYLSLWVPQIIRNTQRNSRRAFAWRFMIGQSILRLLPFAYFYLRKDNLLFGETDWKAFTVLAGWLWVQLWVLAFQDVLGPRFGIPKGWMPEAWDYHPVLREDNLEAGGLPIGLVSSSAPGSPVLDRARSMSGDSAAGDNRRREREKEREKRRMHTRVIDCAICCEVLEVPVVRAGEEPDPAVGGVAGVLERRKYMVTPCRHIFHSACLEGWLRFRLQCPICREELPPL